MVGGFLSKLAHAGTGVGDLERALARIHASSAAEAEGANAAIYYEDTAKRKVLSLVTALRGLQSLQVQYLQSCREGWLLPCNGIAQCLVQRKAHGSAA